jgi:5-methylcytosine-specific restriction protein A
VRRSLSTKMRLQIFQSANGVCDICAGKIQVGERWEVSHRTPIELGGADDPSNWFPAHYKCHRVQTAEIDIPAIAKAKRREARNIGAKRSSRPMPGSRASGLRKHFDGTVSKRT